jgi:transcriptional regulator
MSINFASMYVPKKFKWENKAAILDFIQKNAFGLLVINGENVPMASHLPFFWEDDGTEWGSLTTHIAKGNQLGQLVQNDKMVLAVFQGEHGYVSPSWYDHVNVPTWNYVSVHINGHARLTNRNETIDLLTKILNHYESGRENGRKMEDYSEEFLESHYQGLLGIKIQIEQVDAAVKLSQNRNEANYQLVLKALDVSDFQGDRDLANAMRAYYKD